MARRKKQNRSEKGGDEGHVSRHERTVLEALVRRHVGRREQSFATELRDVLRSGPADPVLQRTVDQQAGADREHQADAQDVA